MTDWPFYWSYFSRRLSLPILLVIIVIKSGECQLQLEKVKFSRIEGNGGVSNSRITCFLQDSKGFLWLGTEDGLNRFDGYEFTVFRHDPKDNSTLLKDFIRYLFEDSNGTIWISTGNGGLQTYNRKLDRFTRINDYSFNAEVNVITEDDEKNLWIAGVKSQSAFAAKFNRSNNSWVNYDILQSGSPILSFMPVSASEFYIGIRGVGFYKWNILTKSLISFPAGKDKSPGIVNNDFRSAALDKKRGIIWIATGGGLSKFNINTKEFENYTVQSSNFKGQSGLLTNSILSLCIDGSYVWVGTENGGLSRLDLKTNQFKTFLSNKMDPASLVGNSIWAIYKDYQARIWIGTYANGLCVIDKLKYKFLEVDIPLKNDVVNAIWEDSKKRFWVGTEEGIVVKDSQKIKNVRFTARANSLGYPVLSIFESAKGKIWIGTWGGGLNEWDEQSQSYKSYPYNPQNNNGLSNPNVFSINEQYPTNDLLLGTYNGLNVLRKESTGAFEKYRDSINEPNNFIHAVYRDKKNNIWIGTIKELLLFDTDKRKLTKLDSLDTLLIHGSVNCIQEDSKGRLWVGTSNGLSLLVNKKSIAHYTTENGLPSNNINGIVEDNAGHLWVSTMKGLSKFTPETKKFVNFDFNDGLLSDEFRRNVFFKNDAGMLFFGGKGINFFHPDSIHSNPFYPPVYITDLKIFNHSVKIGDSYSLLRTTLAETKEITLHERYNFFSLDFVAINFTSSNKNQYAYKLTGFNQDWVYTKDNRTATFTNLDPGTYTFHVKASNNDGLWNEKGSTLVIHILPFWWKTFWFRALALFALVAAIFAYFNYRTYQIRNENEKLEKIVVVRTRDIRLANEKLIERETEIMAQNEELVTQREQLGEQNKSLQESKVQQLELFRQNIVEKSLIIDAITEELRLLKEKEPVQDTRIENFNKILNSTILTDEDWEKFKSSFEAVHPNFFAALRYKYLEITNSELRLLALVKLNLTLKESAKMLGVSPESVKQARYRLKKKLMLPENESLEEFIRLI